MRRYGVEVRKARGWRRALRRFFRRMVWIGCGVWVLRIMDLSMRQISGATRVDAHRAESRSEPMRWGRREELEVSRDMVGGGVGVPVAGLGEVILQFESVTWLGGCKRTDGGAGTLTTSIGHDRCSGGTTASLQLSKRQERKAGEASKVFLTFLVEELCMGRAVVIGQSRDDADGPTRQQQTSESRAAGF